MVVLQNDGPFLQPAADLFVSFKKRIQGHQKPLAGKGVQSFPVPDHQIQISRFYGSQDLQAGSVDVFVIVAGGLGSQEKIFNGICNISLPVIKYTHNDLTGIFTVNGGEKMLKKQLKASYGLFFWIITFFIAFIVSYISPACFLLFHLSSILYVFLIIVWLLSVKKRVVHKTLQRCLIAGAVFLCILFIIRLCRYDFFDESEEAERYLWYLFYLPITAVSMISFFCSVSVGRSDEDNGLKKYLWLIVLWLMMNAGIVTNNIHQSLRDHLTHFRSHTFSTFIIEPHRIW